MALQIRKSPSELRRYRRIPIDLPARAIINGGEEVHGSLINMSPGDLAMKAEGSSVNVGDAAVIFITGFDMVEGTVARTFPDGFALSFKLSRVRRAVLTEKLMMVANPKLLDGLGDRRSAPRHSAKGQRMICRLPDATSLFVRVIDQSVDGVAVEAQKKPPVGADIHVGRMRGIVMRHTARGFVVVYDHGQPRARAGADALKAPDTARRRAS